MKLISFISSLGEQNFDWTCTESEIKNKNMSDSYYFLTCLIVNA